MAAELHRWTDMDGQTWACAAYDHGPFCRLCQPITEEIDRARLDLVVGGLLTVSAGPDGSLIYKDAS